MGQVDEITGNEVLAGSPSYIAPEVWIGGAVAAEVRSDVYSLSVVLFRALTGRLPFTADTIIELMHVVTSEPRPRIHSLRPDLSPDIDAWVEQALSVRPEDRFSSVNGTWRALRNCLADAP